MADGLVSESGSRPNILLITSDEERYTLPHPDGFVLSARERLQQPGGHLRPLLRGIDTVQLVPLGDLHRVLAVLSWLRRR
jgi:hypothetical protein